MMSLSSTVICPFEKCEIACKICDGTDGAMESIFCEESDKRLLNKIFKCTNVKVKPVCGIISPICEFCRFRIDQFDDAFQPSCKEYVVEKVVGIAPEDDPFNCLDPIGSEAAKDDVKIFGHTLTVDDELASVCIQKVKVPLLLGNVSAKKEVLNGQSSKSVKAELADKVQVQLGEAKIQEADSEPDDEKHVEDYTPDWDGQSDSSVHIVIKKKRKVRRRASASLSVLKKPSKCEICGKMVTYMKDHMRQHDEHKRYKCPHCDRSFIQSFNLKYHVRKHTGEKPFACDKCDKTFICKSHLLSHSRSHVNDQPYQCEFCSRRFNQACNLTKHLRVHSGEKPYKCSFCGKAFMNLSNMKTHEKRHRGERNFACVLCPKSFYDNHHLERHIATHSKEKPYKCHICPKQFSSSSGLKSHTANHAKPEESTTCEICKKIFSSSRKLKYHMKSHSSNRQLDKTYTCDSCSRNFKRAEQLELHKQKIHGDAKVRKAPCEIIIDPEKASKQLACSFTKPYRCDVCSKMFNYAANLKTHLFMHMGYINMFNCDKCPRSFHLKKHLDSHYISHISAKPYACEYCSERFDDAESLTDHLAVIHDTCSAVVEQQHDDKTVVITQAPMVGIHGHSNTQLIELPSVVLPETGQVVVKLEIQNI